MTEFTENISIEYPNHNENLIITINIDNLEIPESQINKAVKNLEIPVE